ncbi:MAG: HRDC domain-containing protein [Tepidisphaeraceae bacterium]|jgi:ribonuclease D
MSDDQAHADSSASEQTRHAEHSLACRDAPQLVTRPDELAELLGSLRKAGSFAYDSEFIGELTYLPKLCLVQAASSTRIALIDPLADLDIRPFWELVADPSVEKIVHAGQQDVEPVFRALGKPPANLFDTQIAAGFVGVGYPLSLSKLVQAIIGAKLGKGLTFSHWDRRPLTDHQLRYAADDVRYLPAARHEIGKRLDAPRHARWAMEESASLADQALYVFDPQTQWIKIRGAGTLSPRSQALLKELTIWRDQAAKAEDVPPRSLLKDEILLDLARSPVEAEADLARVKGLPRPIESKYGAGIVQATLRVRNLPQDQLPAMRGYEPSPNEKFAADALFYAIQCLCAAQGIDPSLVASRQEVGELHRLLSAGRDASDLRILRGWRREAVGNRMLELLKGQGELSLSWCDGILRIPTHPNQ